MKVSIKKISEITGYSPATISNALNNKRGVNKNTSAEIFKVAQELGYISENRITKIKFVIYRKNGLVIDDTPFFSLMLDGVERECRNLGYEMSVCNLDYRSDDYEEQLKWLLTDTSSAIILLGTELLDDDIAPYKTSKSHILCLDYSNSDMDFDCVLINNSDSAKMATEHLIDRGHREIGYLRGSFRIKPFRSRAVGYARALQLKDIPLNRQYTVTLSPKMEGAYSDMKEYLKKKPKLPTAFFADNDMIALGAVKALQESGYRIPEDISIIGFDDLPFSEISSPRLTTIRVNKQEIGELAVRRIHEIIKGVGKSKLKINVCTEFIERDSVCDCRQN
ncbi:MAG: LacI family DNA-binding transcriptional regulator [Lachnospiraceae bacterium]|nr:LacI family DNA-binding transcriptional regulator [Lachnospiraceae bacterium]MDD3614777.1 LacI family DNA-binding transcriptional regulator [Lachnospiraceae bacterium]